MDYHTGTIVLDKDEGMIEAEAVYEIDALWSRRDHRGWRSVVYVNSVTLISWTYGSRKQNRETAVALAGDDWIQRMEEIAGTEWRETAEQDDADNYGDFLRDQRSDIAAE